MDKYKLHVKIGPHEFSAEGPVDDVKEQFDAFKELISTAQAVPTEKIRGADATDSSELESSADTQDERLLRILYGQNDKRGLVTLRIVRKGKEGIPESILLILLGYLILRNEEEVGVTKLKLALAQSGIRTERIDRKTVSYVDSGLLIKHGKAKGSRYRLTNTGEAEARRLMEELLKEVN